ncbi:MULTISPECIES: gamma-glutamylcyclotransferase [Methylobacterium]|uniref:glutathione-specific gamma-glutamylcyclotransferase n=1 Tax=Methylobacterium thuringiense TaxID=1003091 RepID=A0ABQ4TKZ6_9HYPH|nr:MULTISPECIES: gamma-glutamylcyclotransferase [Methylobacterium]TXN25040.1 gamma-glutamylcyclotransferase [Methylobacterium sp. WL9]GJE54742.1 Glutathione-specific gamma-glutamylcyclotransferase [Methylobacterium thuringiense]
MSPRSLTLTAALIARAHPAPVADDETALQVLTDAELAPGLARAIAARSGADAPLWVFAYGSLMWNPEFAVAERRIGHLRGWHRRFCLLQRRFRGTPERPGVVLALDRGGSCRGVAFRLDGRDPHAVLMPVWRREMKGRGYAARWVAVETGEGPVTALTFVVNRASDRYTGRLDEPAIADTIATGCGHLGPSAEYLFHTVTACAALGIHDPHLWRLQALVAERLGA